MTEKTLKDLLAGGPTALAGLASAAADRERQDQVLKASLPERIRGLVLTVAPQDEIVIVKASNAERASRLRFLEPEILKALADAGFHFTEMRVRVSPDEPG